jgi:hypothetical protein
MIYKLTTKSGQKIPIENADELKRFIAEANAGKRIVVLRHGIVDVSSMDSIVPYHDLNQQVGEKMLSRRYTGDLEPQYTTAEAERNVLGEPPFADLAQERKALKA